MATSTAVGLERVSRVVGYQLTKGQFQNTTSNLPQRIAILAEANTANQATIDFEAPKEFTTLKEVGDLYGYGSPIYQVMRILRPANSDGVGGIPTIIYPQEMPVGATSTTVSITPTGTATSNATHTIEINGRGVIDGGSFNVNISTGDTVAMIVTKVATTINNVLQSPVIATDGTTEATVETKWKGLTSSGLNIVVNTNGNSAGITYATNMDTTGTGSPTVTEALSLFGSQWNTMVLNSYGEQAFVELESFNGVPSENSPTGRYQAVIMKPFVAFYGDTTQDPTVLTDVEARKGEVTNSVCPAPRSSGFNWEASANMIVLASRIYQDKPNIDVNGLSYSDMPIPSNGDIGNMAQYNTRDSFVKKGSSTVDIIAGRYQVQDLVTTYHPDGETPPAFRYVRNLMLDFNVRYGYYLLEQNFVVDKTILNDDDISSAQDIVKPKTWNSTVNSYADDLANRALIADAQFMKDSIVVSIGASNPDRLETFFRYKRSGVARIASTTAEAGFNFGNI
tara:strand:+ start:522 stop:2048 length:1527 start_codon:yes stop_codon:yes gene_type:complete